MGRRAKPIELLARQGKTHLTKGQIQKRRDGEARLRPPADDIKCPAWLGRLGKREWKRIIAAIGDKDLLTNVDVASLAVYCDAVDKYAEASKAIRTEGVVIRVVTREIQPDGTVLESDAGPPMQNPNVLVTAKYAQIIRAFGNQFGLNPSSRASLAMKHEEDKPEDEFARKFG